MTFVSDPGLRGRERGEAGGELPSPPRWSGEGWKAASISLQVSEASSSSEEEELKVGKLTWSSTQLSSGN